MSTALILLLACIGLSFALCRLLRPLFLRYALARPNARSSHTVPTPQGGGIPVIVATLIAILVASRFAGLEHGLVLAAAIIVIGVLGAWDDVRPLGAGLRLIVQGLCVAALIAVLPPLGLTGGWLPPLIEQGLLVIAGLWFVNLTNFMDGLDGITISGFVPLALAAAAILALAPEPAFGPALVALGLAGGLLGFLPDNRPVARLFLGDVGALAIGLIGAWLLYQVALAAGLAIALALPFYHLADASITLAKRLIRGEKVWEAHRSHLYQQATTNGFTAGQVSGQVAIANGLVAVTAMLVMVLKLPYGGALTLMLAALLTALLMLRFSRKARP